MHQDNQTGDSGPGFGDVCGFEPNQEDQDFLLSTRLIEALPDEAVNFLLGCLYPRDLEAGERFITQGRPGESLFLIQKGRCAIIVENKGEAHLIARHHEGEVVGEMALLTGQARSAHVDAETPMRVWELNRSDFDLMAEDHPALLEFLTELLTNRLEKSATIAARDVGRYRMLSRLGQGGWSFVYRGRHQALNMPVAIKMLKHNLALDEAFLDRFRQEARMIAGMNHESIVQVFDIEERYRTVFIVMENLEGESLKALLRRRGALPFERAATFLFQLCSGLEYAHRIGIVHRDIKPGNIMVLPGDRIKILDFGLACPFGREEFELVGTPGYMSPEQMEGDPVDARSDIYALGVVAYEMFTGQKPFEAKEVRSLFEQHLKKEVPDPACLVPDIPAEVREFILRATRKDPAQRYADVSRILEHLAPLGPGSRPDLALPSPKPKVAVLLVRYNDEQQSALNRLLDEFNSRADELGIGLKMAGESEL